MDIKSKQFKFFSVLFGLMLAAVGAVVGIGEYKKSKDTTPVWAENARTWPSVPLTVVWKDLKNDAYDSSMRGAIQMWNREVGCELFVEQKPQQHGDINIGPYLGSPCSGVGTHQFDKDKRAVAGTWLCPDGSADIQFRTISDIVTAYVNICHELGHAIGLGHQKMGIMREGFQDYDPSQLGGSLPMAPVIIPDSRLTKALAERYCKK